MAFFKRNPSPVANRHETHGHWPLQMRVFDLATEFELTPQKHPEIFVISSGRAVIESDAAAVGKQPLTEHSAIVMWPEQQARLLQVHDLQMTRLRLLPEWFSHDAELLHATPDARSLWASSFFFNLPTQHPVSEIFHLDELEHTAISSDLAVLLAELQAGQASSPLMRLTVLKVLLHLATQHGRFWRGEKHLNWPPELAALVDLFEQTIARGERMNLSKASKRSGIPADQISEAFHQGIGIDPMAYLETRRAQHAASLLLNNPSLPAEIVAERVGFTNVTRLDEQMKRVFNLRIAGYATEYCGST